MTGLNYRRALGHDARTWSRVGSVERRYGWSCPCGAHGKGFKTGHAAKVAATRHNGGYYNDARRDGGVREWWLS